MRVACILAKDFEDSELRVPLDRLIAAGHEVTIIGEKKGAKLKGKKGKERVVADAGIGEVRAEDFGALLIPGGYSPDQLRADERFVDFVKEFDREGKLIAAICHGPQIMITAGICDGRTLTAWKTVQGDLRYCGSIVVDQEVVHDRNFITSRQPDDLEAFSREILNYLATGAAAQLS